MEYVLMTDSDSDLPLHLQQKLNIPYVSMPYSLNGREYYDDLGQSLDYKSYYAAMREGAAPMTSALNETNYLEYFEPILAEKDLLFIAFSSQLSGTIQSVYAAQRTLKEKYPERKFIVVDTLSISAPMTILVLMAHRMYEAGKSIEEVASWLENNKLRSCAWITPDDLKYLKRGGRISATAATVGTMLSLKPIIALSKEGKLASIDKVRGRKKAVNYLVEKTVSDIADPGEAPVIVLHADTEDEAVKLKEQLAEKMPEAEIMLENIGPVIGAHIGPGTLAVCFMGKERPV